MKKTRLKSISKKRKEQLNEYHKLVMDLRRLCCNKSELSGKNATYRPDFDDYKVEPHHIEYRNGDRLLNSYNIIMLTREEHDIQERKVKGLVISNRILKQIVFEIRRRQGY